MKKFIDKWRSLFQGFDQNWNDEGSRRFIVVMTLGVVAVLVLSCVATASLLQGDIKTAGLDFFVGFCILILLVCYKWTKYEQQCRYVGVALMYTLFLYLFLKQAADGTTYMWLYTFPFFSIFLIGARHGAISTMLLFIPAFASVILDIFTPETGIYSVSFASRFIPSMSVTLIFAFLFEKERERFRWKALKAYQEQESIIAQRSEQLQLEIAAKEKINQKLRQSQKMEAIGTMASGVAHDLNNILVGIVTYPQLIRMDLPHSSPIIRHLEAIESAGKRAAAVVDDLLTIARDAASVKEIVNLNQLIDEVLDSPEWSAFISSHSAILVQADLKAEEMFVHCSPVHIRKSIMNLLINAVEATLPVGVVTISSTNHLGIKKEDNNRNIKPPFIYVSILDEGTGILPEHLDYIFDPFYTTKKMGRSGSGLGLSVVWNTIEEHQGKVFAENTPTGARFTFELEVAQGVSTKQAPLKLSIDRLEGTGHLLIVDDEPQLADIAYRIVKKLGYTGVIASSGEDALETIRNEDFDLVLLDMMLGEGMGGYETYKKMISINSSQKAIIVSGYSTSKDVSRTLEIGACTVIKKPYTIEEIGKAILDCGKK